MVYLRAMIAVSAALMSVSAISSAANVAANAASNTNSAIKVSDTRGPDGSTPLQWAVFKNDVGEVKRLLKAGADVAEANVYGATPMSLAAEVGDAKLLKVLLDAGADADSPNSEGQTALMLVARTGNVDAANELIKHGASVNAVEQFGGQTALMWASARRHPKMMELLIAKGANINAQSAWRNWERHITAEGRAKDVNTGGLTPLLYAAREGCLECADILIKHRVDVNLADPDGVAPLTVAMMNRNWEIAQKLILAGADVNQWDIFGMSPLHVAIEVAYASAGGGNSFGGIVGGFGDVVPGNDGEAAKVSLAPKTVDGPALVRMLVERGANPNQQMFYRAPRGAGSVAAGGRGTTPFHRACASGDVELIKYLLAHGADVKLLQADDQSPMMMALSSRRGEDNTVQVLKVLHEAGADVTANSKYHHLARLRGGTALHMAVRFGQKKVISELVSYGIDVNAKDPDGLTALDYAMARGYVPFLAQRQPPRMDIAKELRDYGAKVELAKTPDWPPVGPPIGYEATIWPL
jgi:uncharacterized protein